MSFKGIVDGVQASRKANPGISAAKGLSTDPQVIAEEVEQFNVALCQQFGWTDYITDGLGGGPSPFPQGQNQGQLGRAPLRQKLQNETPQP